MPLTQNLTGRSLTGLFHTEERYDLNILILYHNPKSGLFIAKGSDKFGDSGLVGAIREELCETAPIVCSLGYTIKFHKQYAGLPLNRDGLFRTENTFYEGNFWIEHERVYCEGNFKLSTDENADFEGIWKLQSAE
ncbi:MAG: hypothetical protein V1759_04495 [bacterium]